MRDRGAELVDILAKQFGHTKLGDDLKVFDFIQLSITQSAANYEKECTSLFNYFRIKQKPHQAIEVAIWCLKVLGKVSKDKRKAWSKKIHDLLKVDD
jgi:hypothetical protein